MKEESMDYIECNQELENFMDILHLKFKEPYTEERLSQIRDFALLASSYRKSPLPGKKVKREKLSSLFLEAIATFEDKELLEYFRDRLQRIEIYYDDYMPKGQAEWAMTVHHKKIISGAILLPSLKTTELTATSFAHEMAHVACCENKKKSTLDYFEYEEVIPILLEYFMFRYLKKGKRYFYRSRLSGEKEAATCFLENYPIYMALTDKSKNKKQYYLYDLITSQKYFLSSEFALETIDLLKKNRKEVLQYVKDILLGEKTVRDMEKEFHIAPEQYPRLVKEYERRK